MASPAPGEPIVVLPGPRADVDKTLAGPSIELRQDPLRERHGVLAITLMRFDAHAQLLAIRVLETHVGGVGEPRDLSGHSVKAGAFDEAISASLTHGSWQASEVRRSHPPSDGRRGRRWSQQRVPGNARAVGLSQPALLSAQPRLSPRDAARQCGRELCEMVEEPKPRGSADAGWERTRVDPRGRK